MSDAARRARLRALVEKISKKEAPADDEESLFESRLLDSFDLADLVGAIEEEFGVKIPDSDLNPRKFDSVARMDEYVGHRLKPAPPA
jgi:acyl carrier protein